MSNKASDIKLIQLNSYVRPTLQEDKSKGWVMNGKKNVFYKYTIDRFNGSPTNAAIINTYIDLIYGRGLTSDNKEALEKLNEVLTNEDLKRIIADFELFGEASIQVISKKSKENLPQLKHIAKNKVIPSIEDEEGYINSYWYSNDWEKYMKPENQPQEFDCFGKEGSSGIQIYNIKPYKAGKNYFSDPDYLAGMPYAEMEEEIANYCINHIQNGLSFGYIINVPDGANWEPEVREKFERQLKSKLTGSQNAGKFIIAFNGREMQVDVVPLDVNSAHKQWEFLVAESRQQILTAHRVTSPMLFGIKDNTGLGNNASELDTAEQQLYKRVVAPKQKIITDAIEEIMLFYGIEAEFKFIPLTETTANADKSFTGIQISSAVDIITNVNNGILTEDQGRSLLTSMLSYPLEELDELFSSKTTKTIDSEVEEQATELKKQNTFDADRYAIQKVIDSVADEFIMSGEKEEDILKEFELVQEDAEQFNLKEQNLNQIIELARAPSSTPKKKSEQDTSLFKIRYKYAGAKADEKTREFCRKVLKEDRVYRWEDLEMASTKVVNKGFGIRGADTYDIAKYKGGVNCRHFWQRKIYLRRNNKAIGVNQARKMILQLPPDERADAKWVQNPKEVAQIAGPSNNYWRVS